MLRCARLYPCTLGCSPLAPGVVHAAATSSAKNRLYMIQQVHAKCLHCHWTLDGFTEPAGLARLSVEHGTDSAAAPELDSACLPGHKTELLQAGRTDSILVYLTTWLQFSVRPPCPATASTLWPLESSHAPRAPPAPTHAKQAAAERQAALTTPFEGPRRGCGRCAGPALDTT